MKKIYSLLGPRITIINLIILLYGEVAGIMHSVKKHSRNEIVLAVLIPPVSWYRSIELLWHNENNSLDWNKLLNNDLCLIIDLYNQSEDDQNILNIDEISTEYAKKISLYPKYERQKLVVAFKMFNEYQSSLFDDMQPPTLSYFETGQINFRKSKKTKELENELLHKFDLKKYFDVQNKKIKEYSYQLNSELIKCQSKDEIEKIKSKYILIMTNNREKNAAHFKRLFENIFKEKITVNNQK